MTNLEFDDLRPFQSAVFAYHSSGSTPSVRRVIVELRKLLKVKTSGSRRQRSLQIYEDEAGDDGWGILQYSHRQPASWVLPGVEGADDITNYLLAVVRRGKWMAITMTEGSRRPALMKALRYRAIEEMQRVPPSLMKSAFVSGRPRTLWLKGTHRPDTVKADNKVLTGRDLRDALDPIGDQTYRYTAVRCEAPDEPLGDVIGVAVDQGRMWAARSGDWQEYVSAMLTAIDALANATPHAAELLPVLALSGADLTDVERAFDLGITPPELLTIGPTEVPAKIAELQALEDLAYNTAFEVTGRQASTGLDARVTRYGTHIGDLALEIKVDDERVAAEVTGAVAVPGQQDALDEIRIYCEMPEMVTIFYESGHSIVDGQVCTLRYRDVSFEGFAWADFSAYEVAREKPDDINELGGDRSLFAWTLNEWPSGAGIPGARGWLLCDDRPGETCDFIHLDDTDPNLPPLLSLIHVKAAKSSSSNREISVVAYETVTGQAVKNLRHLDKGLLEQGIAGAVTRADPPVWRDGTPVTYAAFQQHIAGLSPLTRRRVVIVQPHLTRTALTTGRSATAGPDLARRRQLETLLVGARANVQAMGAELVVVGDAR
jgi:hypothetical protein